MLIKTTLFLLLPVFFLGSCRSAWNQEDTATFRKACISDAKTWAGSDEKAASYCDCVIAKVKAKYANENEALKHIDSLVHDKELQECRSALMNK